MPLENHGESQRPVELKPVSRPFILEFERLPVFSFSMGVHFLGQELAQDQKQVEQVER